MVGGWVEAHTKVFGSLRRVCSQLNTPRSLLKTYSFICHCHAEVNYPKRMKPNIVHTLELQWAARYCIVATSFYYTDHFKLGAEAVSKRKHFAKAAKPLRGRKERHGYVILVSNEPRCYHAATSERRRIRLKADYYYIALRGASIRRSQRGNSEAVFFRGTLPRQYSIRRSKRGNNSATPQTLSTTFVTTHPPFATTPRTTTFHKPPLRHFFHNFHKKKEELDCSSFDVKCRYLLFFFSLR